MAQLVPVGGGTATMLVAGMHAATTYHMRAHVALSDGTTLLDSDHTFTTGPLPGGSFPAVTVTPAATLPAGSGVELLSDFGPDISTVALDTDGSVIWYYFDPALPAGRFPTGAFPFPIRQLDNGDFLINYGVDVREVDLAGNIVRKITLDQLNAALSAAGSPVFAVSIHHDVLPLSNGHWIVLINENHDFQDLPGYPGTTTVLADDLVELDANNQVVWIWRALDHLDVNRHPYQFPDWTHCNAVVLTADGNLLLSVRHQSWVLKIDYANGAGAGDILWRLGPQGDFTLSEKRSRPVVLQPAFSRDSADTRLPVSSWRVR